MADADTRFWLEIPPNERAEVVWQLSVEAHQLADVAALIRVRDPSET